MKNRCLIQRYLLKKKLIRFILIRKSIIWSNLNFRPPHFSVEFITFLCLNLLSFKNTSTKCLFMIFLHLENLFLELLSFWHRKKTKRLITDLSQLLFISQDLYQQLISVNFCIKNVWLFCLKLSNVYRLTFNSINNLIQIGLSGNWNEYYNNVMVILMTIYSFSVLSIWQSIFGHIQTKYNKSRFYFYHFFLLMTFLFILELLKNKFNI